MLSARAHCLSFTVLWDSPGEWGLPPPQHHLAGSPPLLSFLGVYTKRLSTLGCKRQRAARAPSPGGRTRLARKGKRHLLYIRTAKGTGLRNSKSLYTYLVDRKHVI